MDTGEHFCPSGGLENTARSRNARRAALRTFLKYAVHYDVTALPVIERTLEIPLKRYDRPMLGFLSRPEMEAILAAPNLHTWTGQRDRVLLTMLYNTGARVSEIIGVRFKDLILEHAPSVHLYGKGRKDRAVPLWSTTTSLLRKWKRHLIPAEDSAFLLPNRNQTKMTRSNVTQRCSLPFDWQLRSVNPYASWSSLHTPLVTPRPCISCSPVLTSQ